MAIKFLLGQSQINIIDGVNYRIKGAIKMSDLEYTNSGINKKRALLPLLDGDYKNRTMGWTQQIFGTSQDDLNAKYNAFINELQKPRNTFIYNTGGVTESDSTVVFFSANPTPPIETHDLGLHRFELAVKLEIRPFSTTGQIDLPANLIHGAAMWEDWNLDGICNSFSDANSGAGKPTYTQSIDADGWQKIDVTAGGNVNQYGGVLSQTISVTAGNVMSFSCSYRTSATLTNCRVQAKLYFNDGGSTIKAILDTATPTVTETVAKLENYTVPAGATSSTLYLWLIGTAAGMVGTLWVRKALAIVAASIPTDDSGNPMWWSTYEDEGPGTIRVHNVPGNFPALARIGVEGTGTNSNRLIIGKCDTGLASGGGLINILPRAVADANCLGGERSTLFASAAFAQPYYSGEIQVSTALTGTYVVYAKLWCDNASLYYNWFAWQGGVAKTGPLVKNPGASNWFVVVLGTVNIPLASRAEPTVSDTVNIGVEVSDGNGGGWAVASTLYMDYFAVLPGRQQIYAEGGAASAQAGAGYNQYEQVVSDSITGWLPSTIGEHPSGPGLFWPTGGLTWPLNSNVLYPWAFDNNGVPLMLDPGVNEMATLVYDTTTQQTNHGFSSSISLMPRYLFTP